MIILRGSEVEEDTIIKSVIVCVADTADQAIGGEDQAIGGEDQEHVFMIAMTIIGGGGDKFIIHAYMTIFHHGFTRLDAAKGVPIQAMEQWDA